MLVSDITSLSSRSRVCLQSTVVDLASGVLELDSDMADITQSLPTESMLGGEEDGDLLPEETGGKLGGLVSMEHDGVSASGHIASSLGINPHTLQVEPQETHRLSDQVLFPVCSAPADR